jgi:hypothetical protein
MDTIYNYNNYEIILKKCVDSVYIQFLDKQLFKLYSNTYIDIDVIKFTMGNLDMFYKVMVTVFESITNSDDKAKLEIYPSAKNLKLSVHHKYYLEFIFELQLNLVQEHSLSAKEMCVKKLEKKIDELKVKHDSLQTFINDYMELTITDNFNQHNVNHNYIIKVNTPIIKIFGVGLGQGHLNNMVNNIYVLNTDGPIKYNNNFKIIKCQKLIIENPANGGIKDYDFGYNNLPLSITTLVIMGYIGINNFKNMDLPNITTMEFESCQEITNIYASISHLKSLKNITIKNCPKFQERDLLLTHWYNFQTV